MPYLLKFFIAVFVIAGAFLLWLYKPSGKKWLKNL